ncbi:IS3 family transposase [Candidatus Phytoplasma australasiaticum]|uniref:IS3 family transposase n=1 Tax=Candidatus Phytoplasma australasiaticum subsp. australasiaticum TaxID=2832407 RepID=A0AAP4X8K7_9MOLU|nr:IS3 family transposase [Candidatus Phytoplasma australasiaticum]MDO8054668.1 IS3 family transposase [Candidatus Phytoplasma australasiaticum]
MLIPKQIELLQTVILYQRPDLSKIILPLVKVYRQTLTITQILNLLKIKRHLYYYWRKSQKAQQKRQHHYQLITKRVGLLCQKYHYACGYRKITVLYREFFQEIVNHKIILKIMKTNNWLMKWRRPHTKNQIFHQHVAYQPNLIKNHFVTDQPLTKLYTDLTCFPTTQGLLWVSVILDGYHQEILSLKTSLKPNLKLIKATFKVLPSLTKPCIIHSDRGGSYSSRLWQQTLQQKGFLISMSRPGCPNDNAPIESWFSNLKGWFKSRYGDWYHYSFGEIIKKIQTFKSFYNHKWPIKKLNYQSPLHYLQNYQEKKSQLQTKIN